MYRSKRERKKMRSDCCKNEIFSLETNIFHASPPMYHQVIQFSYAVWNCIGKYVTMYISIYIYILFWCGGKRQGEFSMQLRRLCDALYMQHKRNSQTAYATWAGRFRHCQKYGERYFKNLYFNFLIHIDKQPFKIKVRTEDLR